MAQALPLIIYRNSPPSVIDDINIGVEVNSRCHVGARTFICIDNTAYAAVWQESVSGGGGGVEITDSGTIDIIKDPLNYNDSYGRPSPPVGGIFNTTIPSGISEHDYYIEPAGTLGLPRHKIECKKIASTLSLIRIPYIY